jgi:hypothetical protein
MSQTHCWSIWYRASPMSATWILWDVRRTKKAAAEEARVIRRQSRYQARVKIERVELTPPVE